MRQESLSIRGRVRAAVGAGILALAAAPPAAALQFNFDELSATINTSMEIGAQWRMQDRDSRLVGKANLNPELCAISSCQGHSNGFDENGNPEPGLGVIGEGPDRNQRAVDAPGVFSINHDDGNLNFDKYDVTQGLVKIAQDITLNFEAFDLDWKFFGRYYGHYDFANYDRLEYHPNRITQNAINNNPDSGLYPDDDPPNRRLSVGEPVFVERNDRQQEQIGLGFQVLDFNLNTRLPFIGDRDLDVTIGRQLINWGESTYLAVGSLNTFSSLDANAFMRPAYLNVEETFRPLGAVSLKTDLTYDIGISAWYGYEWEPAQVPPPGSFFSFVDLDTHNSANSIAINFGKTGEDPQMLALGNQTLLVALAETGATAELLPQREAQDGGQYGVAMSFYFPNLFTGTELNLYYARYHSRLPFLSAYAGEIGCLENTVPSGSQLADTLAVFTDCPTAHLESALWAIQTGGDPANDPNGGQPEQDTGRQTNPDG